MEGSTRVEVARMGDSAFTPRTRCRRAGCIQRCLSGSGGGGWIPLVTRGWPPTSCAGDVGLRAEVERTEGAGRWRSGRRQPRPATENRLGQSAARGVRWCGWALPRPIRRNRCRSGARTPARSSVARLAILNSDRILGAQATSTPGGAADLLMVPDECLTRISP